jgi:hypothetical protein
MREPRRRRAWRRKRLDKADKPERFLRAPFVFSQSIGVRQTLQKRVSEMTTRTEQTGKRRKQPKRSFAANHPSAPGDAGDNPKAMAKDIAVLVPQVLPKTTKGQKHVSPPERHSQQTHRRAEARAAAEGHATEQEQHAHDRSLVVARLQKRHGEQQKNQQQNEQNKKSALEQEKV